MGRRASDWLAEVGTFEDGTSKDGRYRGDAHFSGGDLFQSVVGTGTFELLLDGSSSRSPNPRMGHPLGCLGGVECSKYRRNVGPR